MDTSITIEEGTYIISVFMGYQHLFKNMAGHWRGSKTDDEDQHEPLPDYHLEWNELMPVVEKINKTGKYSVTIECSANGTNAIYGCLIEKCYWKSSRFHKEKICGKGGRLNNSIEPAYEAIVEFIQYYNSLTSK